MSNLITENLALWTNALEMKSGTGRGSSKKLNLYGIKKLRELILELAVRGKLVPQDPSDEPASVLLERIAEEKAVLVKEKKIKRTVKLPEIKTAEKSHTIPETWAWVRFGNIAQHNAGKTLDKGRNTGEMRDYITTSNLYWGHFILDDLRQMPIKDEEIEKCSATKGDLLIVEGGEAGRASVWEKNYDICFQNHIHRARLYDALSAYYFFRLFEKINYTGEINKYRKGVGISNMSGKSLASIPFPLPPLEEQKRIVAKVDELMALCDELEYQTESSITAHELLVETLLNTLTNSVDNRELSENWNRIADHFETLFTTESSIDKLKQTVLQLAVMGKLVEQDPSDEPASVLLEKIAEEKARLVKEKVIKKQKALPEITEDEKPFELPDGWEWKRFEDLVNIQSGITKGRKLAGRELTSIPYLRVANVQRGYLDLLQIKEVEIPKDEIEKFAVYERDLLITEGGDWDKVGRTAIWKNELPYIAHQNHVFKARLLLNKQNELWLEKYLNSKFARDYFAGSSKQTTNLASINKTQLRGCLIAYPPLAEQHRIVTKVNQLTALCEQLTARITESKTIQKHFADAVVESIVE